MHEVSLAIALVDQLENVMVEHKALRVTSATVEIGALSGVDAAALALAFPAAARGTPVEGATLMITPVAAAACCRHCAERQALDPLFPVCKKCGNTGLDLVAGREMVLASADLAMEEG